MQEECERREHDEEQALLAADHGYLEWLEATDEWLRSTTGEIDVRDSD